MDKIQSTNPSSVLLYNVFGFVLISSIFFAIYFENPVSLIIPILALVAYAGIINLNRLYAFFFVLLPFSLEVSLPGGLGTDLPAEPFMIGLTLIALMIFVRNYNFIDAKLIRHPITIVLILHLIWIGLTAFFSQDLVVSIKFFVAKLWYVIPFYFLAFYLVRRVGDFRILLKGIIASLCFAILFVMISHSQTGFSFDSINQAVSPLFRNHVNYACLITLLMPYCWYLYKTSAKGFSRTVYLIIILAFLIAIYFSFTRAAYIAIGIAIGASYIIKLRLSKIALMLTIVLAFGSISYLAINNNYLDYKPDFEKAITHKKFDNLIEATTKLEDISTVERFYRWIAGTYMVADRPLMGFGPGTFYFFYQSYTVTGFQTYVSDNPEKSGIHNYYLMTAVEQGMVGFLILLAFCFLVIIKGEQIYHRTKNEKNRYLVMSLLLSFIIICAILLINDMVEAAKVGPFFFLAPALLVIYDLKASKE